MGELRDCIERAQRQAEALSIRAAVQEEYRMAQEQKQERQCIEQEQYLQKLVYRMGELEDSIAELKKRVAALSRREADSNTELKQVSPLHMPFAELSQRHGYIAQREGGNLEWVIPEDIVKGWLSSVGIGGLI